MGAMVTTRAMITMIPINKANELIPLSPWAGAMGVVVEVFNEGGFNGYCLGCFGSS